MADNYGTVAGATAYFTARGKSAQWSAVANKDAALLVASETLDGRYGVLFSGSKSLGRAQAREWPRISAYDISLISILSTEIPIEVQYATYELALREGTLPGSLNVDFSAADVITEASVEGAVSVKFGEQSASNAQLLIPIVDQILAPLLVAFGVGSQIAGRAIRAW